MSYPMTADQTLRAFKAEGIKVREYPGWRDRCRCHEGSHERNERRNGNGWFDVVGQVAHITAGDLNGRSVESYIRDIINGDPNVPSKSQTVIAPNGDVWLNSTGRCNHAGKVGAGVRAALLGDRFSLNDAYDSRWRGGAVDGNSFTYGDEVITSKNMTTAQRASLVKVHAARAKFHKWDGRQSVGHGEISSARYPVDPGLDMGKFRRDVNTEMKPTPKPPPPYVRPTAGDQFARIGFWNLAAYDAVKGAKTIEARRLGMEAAVKAANLHVGGFCEIGNPARRALWRYSMSKIGLKSAQESHGRGIFYNPKFASRLASGTWVLDADDAGDHAHTVWSIFKIGGAKVMFVVGHLENRASADGVREDQFTETVKRARARAKVSDISDDRIFFMHDENDNLDDLALRLGFVDAFRAAHSAVRAGHRSTTAWTNTVRTGGRIDKIRVGVKRPVLAANNVAAPAAAVTDRRGKSWTVGALSDHTLQIAVLARFVPVK